VTNKTTISIIVFVTILFSAVVVCGQDKKTTGFAELQTTTTSTGTVPQFALSLERPVTKKVGVFFYGLKTKGYSEAYAGLTYSPKPWIELAAGLGAEGPRHVRAGGYVWTRLTRDGKLTNLFIPECKGSGFWYKNTTNFAVTKNVKVGVREQRFKGAGPEAEYDIPHTPLRVWTTVFFSPDHSPVAQFGLRWKLKF
jgi:hypothetical protein